MKAFPLCLLSLALFAAPAAAQQLNEKAARYLEPLLKRPGSGPLFERFVDAWLDADTLENLQKYLAAKVQAEDTTAHRLLLAVFLSRQGETVKALEQFRAALAKDPGSADIWYQKAVVEARTLDFDSAVVSLRRAREAKPAAALELQAGQLLGRLLARSGKSDEALKVWQELMAARPDDEELREDVLELQITEGLHAAAQATAEALVAGAKDPYKKILHRLRLGDVHDRAGARDKALDTYAGCLGDAGADSWLEKEITAQIEKLYRREDDLTGLKAFHAKLLAREPQRLGLRRAQAKLLVETGEVDAAVAAGRELLKLAPGDRAVREEFIALLAGAQKLPEAIAQLEELRKQAPNDAELLLRLASLQNDAGKKQEAAALVREFVKLSGDEASRLRASGLLERCGMTDEAAAVLREGDLPALRQSLASVLHKNGKKDEALAEWRKLAAAGTAATLEAARAMSAHSEIEAAWLLLKDHEPRAERDAAFLTALCQAAERTDHAAEALPFARRLVSGATLPEDVDSALDMAVRLARKADQVDALTAALAGAATAQELALLAALREEARDSAGAESALKKAEAVSPEIAASLLVRLYSLRADHVQAAMALERLFLTPGGRRAHHAQSLTDLWTRAGSAEKALKSARDWRQLAPGSTAPVLGEARLLETAGRDAEALEVLRRAAGQFEGNEDIRGQLAQAYADSGRMADALRIYSSLYENAAELSAKMRWLQAWAQAAEQAGRTQELVEQFEERRRASRDSVVPLLALAEIHRAANNYDGRRKALMEAARLKQNNPDLALEIARLESREENSDAAIRTLRAALPHDKTGAVRQDLVLLLLNGGERDEGLRLLAEGQADALKDAAVVESVAEGLIARDTAETALAFLRPHLAAHPGDYRLQLLAAHLELEEKPEPARARLLAVLGQRTELPDARLKPLQGSFMRSAFDEEKYAAMLGRVLPAAAEEILQFSLKSSMVSRSWQQRSRGGRQQSLELPENLTDARLTAAALLLDERFFPNEGHEKALLDEMERAGFAHVRLIRDLGEALSGSIYDEEFAARLKEASEAEPENETLLALAAIGQLTAWDQPPDTALAARVWLRFGKTKPLLGLMGALPAAGAGDAAPAWEEEVLRAAEAIQKPDEMLLNAAVRAVGSPFDEDMARETRPEALKRLSALLHRWFGAADFTGPTMSQMHSIIFMTLAESLEKAGESAGFAKLLDEEASRPADNRPGGMTFSFGGQQRSVVRALGFPPSAISLGLSSEVVQTAGPRVEGEDAKEGRMGPEELRKAADLVQHPVVKLLLLVRAGDEAAAAKLMEQRLAAPEPDAASHLLAAAWAEKQGDYARAAEVAKKALFLPLSKETRKALDGAFLAWAESDRGSEPVQAAAREAALRMRRDALTPEARQQLAAVMDTLGLTNEAEKLAGQDAGAAPSPGSYFPQASRVQTPSGKLLAEGRKDKALPLLVKELQAFGREALKPSGWNSVNGFEEWHSLLRQYAMVPPVTKAVPAGGADAKALALHGAILDLMGDAKGAEETYKKALAAGSKEDGVRARLLRLIAAAEPQEAAKLLLALPAGSRLFAFSLAVEERNRQSGTSIGTMIGGRAGEEGEMGNLQRLLDGVEVLEAYAGMAGAEGLKHAGWLSQALNRVAGYTQVAGAWVAPSLFSEHWAGPMLRRKYAEENDNMQVQFTGPGPQEDAPLPNADAVKAMMTQRAEKFDGIVARLLANPGTACMGWETLRQRRVFDAEQPMSPALFDEGVAAVLRDTAGAKASQDAASWHTVYYWLLPAALRADRLADVETKLLPELRRVTKGKVLEALEREWSLYRCEPGEFLAKAKAAIAKTRGESWNSALKIAVLRRTGVELTEDLLGAAETKIKAGQNIENLLSAFPEAAKLILTLKGREAVEAWLRSAWERLTGPREERGKALAGMDEDGNIPGKRGQAILWMSWLSSSVKLNPELVFGALRVHEEEFLNLLPEEMHSDRRENFRLQGDGNWVQNTTRHVRRLLDTGGAEKALGFLRQSPLLGSVAEFRSYGADDGLFDSLPDVLVKADAATLAALGLAGKTEAMTFGQALLTAGLQPERVTAVCEAMPRWQKEIAALPKARRTELLELLREWADIESDPPDGLSGEALAFRQWLKTAGGEEKLAGLEERVTQFLEPKSLRELKDNQWGSRDRIEEMLALLLEAKSPRAREVVEKLRETAQQMERDPEENPLNKALDQLLQRDAGGPDGTGAAIGLTLHAMTAAGTPVQPLSWEVLYSLKRAGSLLGRMRADPVARMKLVADSLAPHVSPASVPLLLPVLTSALLEEEKSPPPPLAKTCKAVLAWAQGGGKTHARQDIVREIAAAADLVMQGDEASDEAKFTGVTVGEKLPPWQRHFWDALQLANAGAPAKLTAATLFLHDAGELAEDAFVHKAVALLEWTVNERVAVPAWQEVLVMEALNLREPVPVDLTSRVLAIARTGRSALAQSYETSIGHRGVIAALRAALRSGSEEHATRVIRVSADQFDAQCLAILARLGTPEQMRTVIRPGRNKLFEVESGNGGTDEFWRDDLTAKLDAALTSVEQEDLRYLARLAVHSLHGVRYENKTLAGPRLATLAAEFGKVKFRTVALRESALELLAAAPESAAVVAPQIRESLEGLTIVTIESLKDDAAKIRKKKMFFAVLQTSAAQGDFSLLEPALQELLSGPAKPDSDAMQLATACLAAAGAGVLPDWQKKPEALAKACAVFRTACAQPKFATGCYYWPAAAQFTALLHAMADRMGELDVWWKALPAEHRKALELGLSSADFHDMVTGSSYHYSSHGRLTLPGFNLPEWPGNEAAAARLRDAVFLRFVSSPLSGGGFSLSHIESFEYSGWGELQDAVRLEEQWAAASHQPAVVAVAFGQFYIRHQDHARTLRAAERSLRARGPARTGWQLDSLCHATAARYHLRQMSGGTDAVLKAAALPKPAREDYINPDRIGDALRMWDQILWMAGCGPARETGSLTVALQLAALRYAEEKGSAHFWSRLEAAGVEAAEKLMAGQRPDEARAAATFALKARDLCEQQPAPRDTDMRIRARAVLRGAVPGQPLLARDAAWQWLESSASAPDKWRETAFDAGAWKSGPGPLGFGDKGLQTTIGNAAPDGEVLISWPFRAEFDVADPAAVAALTLNFLADDGAIVWLNGKEAGRRNLPKGALTHRTLAPLAISQADEGKLEPMVLDPKLLVKGRNCLAVQVHQQRPDSSDAAFHAELLQSTAAPGAAVEPGAALRQMAPLLKDWPEELRKAFLP